MIIPRQKETTNSTIQEIRHQKEDMLMLIRQERRRMKTYSDQLLLPFREQKKISSAPATSPIGRITQKIEGVRYAYKICKGLFSLIKVLH